MIKNSELALISDEALSAVLTPRPVPGPRVAITRRGPRPRKRADAIARVERTPETTIP